MIVVDRSALVAHGAHEMYALVADVASYPQFLPWCDRAVVSVSEPGRTVATLHINFRGLKKEFTTENLNQPGVRGFRVWTRRQAEATANRFPSPRSCASATGSKSTGRCRSIRRKSGGCAPGRSARRNEAQLQDWATSVRARAFSCSICASSR